MLVWKATDLRRAEWVVYAKRPFGGPQAVLAYLSRYTHRVAIANSRLIACDCNGVTYHGRTEDDDQSTEAVQQAADEPFWIRREDTRAEIGVIRSPQVPKRPGLVRTSCLAAAKRTSEAAPRQKNASDINQPKRPNWYSLIRCGALNSGSTT